MVLSESFKLENVYVNHFDIFKSNGKYYIALASQVMNQTSIYVFNEDGEFELTTIFNILSNRVIYKYIGNFLNNLNILAFSGYNGTNIYIRDSSKLSFEGYYSDTIISEGIQFFLFENHMNLLISSNPPNILKIPNCSSCKEGETCVKLKEDRFYCYIQPPTARFQEITFDLCSPGYFSVNNRCYDIDECKEHIDKCSKHGFCTNVEGDYLCSCLNGYEGDGFVCTDINECLPKKNNCSKEGSSCTNIEGGYVCSCLKGFKGNGHECIQISHDLECNGGIENLPGRCINGTWIFTTEKYFELDNASINLNLVNMSLKIDGNISISNNGIFNMTLTYENPVRVSGCINLNGTLVINAPVINESIIHIIISDSKCITGNFSNVKLNTKANNCKQVDVDLKYTTQDVTAQVELDRRKPAPADDRSA